MPPVIPPFAPAPATTRLPIPKKNDRLPVARHPRLPAAPLGEPISALAHRDLLGNSGRRHRLPPVPPTALEQPRRFSAIPALGRSNALTRGGPPHLPNFLRKP